MELHKNLEIRAFTTLDQWLAWLAKHYTVQEGLWIKFAKKSSDKQTITYEQAREGALIYGWIDGLTNSLDEDYYAIRFTPRRAKGRWSKINRDIVEELITAGRMQPSGLAAVNAAKADGRWDAAYTGQATTAIPADLQEALDANPEAAAYFDTITKANRYAFLFRIINSSRPETRARHIAKTIEMLKNKKTYH